jgi:hypothetical protein
MSFFDVLGGLVGGGLSYLGGREQSDDLLDAQREANNFLREGRARFEGTPIVTDFMPGGTRAFNTRQALLGLGGDEAAAQQAFDNYLDSTGFQFALDTGRDAITGSRAARGLLDSGATAEGLTEFGNQLGRQAFTNYIGELGSDAQFGLNAGQTYGNVITNNASQMATMARGTGQDLSGVTGNMYGGIAAGAGQVFEGLNNFFTPGGGGKK